MAKIYNDFAEEKLMSFAKSFATMNGQPLNKSEIWYDKDALDIFASSEKAYVGQKVVYINTEVEPATVTHYSIEADGTLKQLGNTEEIMKYIGDIPEDSGVNTIIEYIDKRTEGIATDVALGELQKSVNDLEDIIGDIPEGKTVVEMIADAQDAATYDDTLISGRVKNIEDDYLKSSDKTEIEGKIATAKSEAISEAVTTVLGEGVSEDFDTLKEVADWILSDTTGAAALITRVTTIEEDYLKGADKEELNGKITALNEYVGTLPETSNSETVISYIQEVIDGLNIGDYAKASELLLLSNRVGTIENKITEIENIGAEKNIINSVDESFEIITDDNNDRKLSLLDIAISKVKGLNEELEKKVDVTIATQNQGIRFINQTEIDKLSKLALDGDSVVVSGTISAGNVTELYDNIVDIVTGVGTGTFDGEVSEKLGIEKGAEVNIIDAISFNGVDVEIIDKKASIVYNIPVALLDTLGGVKSSNDENKISVNQDGIMEVNSINVNKIVQTENDVLILDGGNSNLSKNNI